MSKYVKFKQGKAKLLKFQSQVFANANNARHLTVECQKHGDQQVLILGSQQPQQYPHPFPHILSPRLLQRCPAQYQALIKSSVSSCCPMLRGAGWISSGRAASTYLPVLLPAPSLPALRPYTLYGRWAGILDDYDISMQKYEFDNK